jgi:hypothetical protein
MAESTSIEQREPGAPIAPGEIDPDLVKLARSRPRIGVITAAGLVVLSFMFLIRLGDDRRFGCASERATPATVASILAGQVEPEQLVTVTAEPLVSQAIRAAKNVGNMGLRVVPVRGTADRLWIVVPGDGWQPAAMAGYTGRLRKLDDLAFASAVRRYAAEHPRPVFATPAAVHAGLATGRVTTVAGDQVQLADGDEVALDMLDPAACTVTASFTDRLPDTAAWTAKLAAVGVVPAEPGAPDAALGQVRFAVAASAAKVTAALEAAKLFGARVEPVTRHVQTSWVTLRASPAGALALGRQQLPDAQLDLIGLYVSHAIPAGAYAVVTGELPDDYWYVLPIEIALAAISLLFAWALVRAIRRDVVAARSPDPAA